MQSINALPDQMRQPQTIDLNMRRQPNSFDITTTSSSSFRAGLRGVYSPSLLRYLAIAVPKLNREVKTGKGAGMGTNGSDKLHSDRDTEAWFAIWNVLTFGKTGRDGLSMWKGWVDPSKYQRVVEKGVALSYASRPAFADMHRFFVPLNGVVVYDHTVGYDLLRDVPLIYITGKEISDATMKAIRKCVSEGAVCVAWGPLAAKHGYADWKEGVKVIPEGKGKMILTDDFGLAAITRETNPLVGHPDEIRYRFGEHEVVLKRVTDDEVSVSNRSLR